MARSLQIRGKATLHFRRFARQASTNRQRPAKGTLTGLFQNLQTFVKRCVANTCTDAQLQISFLVLCNSDSDAT
jgi:hypothetical protein